MKSRPFVALLLTLLFGLIILYSASQANTMYSSKAGFFQRQMLWTFIGFCAFAVSYSTPMRVISFFTPFFYGFILITLVIILVLPPAVTSTHRWISLGFFKFQPAEFAKLATILMLAQYFSHRTRPIDSLKESFLPLLIAVIPMVLILIQPDLGSSLAFGPIVLALLYWGGLRLIHVILLLAPLGALSSIYSKWFIPLYTIIIIIILFRSKLDLIDNVIIISLTTAVSIAAPFLWDGLKDYQKQRIFTFFDPDKDPLGAGYQIIQSQVAIGSGGWTGKGYLEGSQKNLSFLPEQHTDFIFSVIGEEFGWIGIVCLLALYAWLLMEFITIAQKTGTRFASFVTLGVAILLMTHVIINIGMTLGSLPVVGIPLPLVSYGGSSLVMTLFSLGLAFSAERRENQFF